MAHFSFERKALLRVLSEEQILTVHENALKILEETGARFDNERALKLLEEKGCMVDYENNMVRFPRELVNQAIKDTPETFDMYNAAGDKTLEMGKGNTYFIAGTGITIVGENGVKHSGTTPELEEALDIIQQSKNLDVTAISVTPEDLEEGMSIDINFDYQAIKRTNKTMIAEAWEQGSVEKILTIMKSLKGGKEEIYEKPFLMLGASPAPPLKWEERIIDVAFDCIEYGIPVFVTSAPLLGATAPVTIAGGLLLHTVETLSFITFMQLVKPGARVFYGGVSGAMDMRTTYSSLSGVEACLLTAAYGAMAQYYGIPSQSSQALTDSKVMDYQAGFETSMGCLVSALAGFDLIWGAGALDNYASFDKYKLMADNHLFEYVKVFNEGIPFDEETLAVEEIMEVGPGDEETHMQRDFTSEMFRESLCMPGSCVDRNSFVQWEKAGMDIKARAAKEILKTRDQFKLDPELEEKLEAGYKATL